MAEVKWMYKHNLIITTPRLILRGWDADDNELVAAVYRMRNDEPALKYVLPYLDAKLTSARGYKSPKTLEEAKEFVGMRLEAGNTFNFIVELRRPANDSLLGTSANIIGMVGGVRAPEFGYQLDSKYWGNGYALEGMRAIIDAYWDFWPNGMSSLPEKDRNKIVLKIIQEHVASIAIAEKLGFSKVGETEEVDKAEDGSELRRWILDVFELQRPDRPAPGMKGAKPRAYDKMEAIGPNLSEGPPITA